LYSLKDGEIFKSNFFRSIDKMKMRFDIQSRSDESLFMTQLTEVIENFASQAEIADGDCVADVCIGFTNNSDDSSL
jgi:hypothetical protein